MSRPSAAEVRARAKLILETLDDGEPVIEEQIHEADLIEISFESTVPQLPALRTRWTPPLGVATSLPAATGIAIGILKPRS
jgi:hypothetical protein